MLSRLLANGISILQDIGRRWYLVHALVQSCGIIIALGAFVLAIHRFGDQHTHHHYSIGLAAIALMVMQPLTSIPRLCLHHVSGSSTGTSNLLVIVKITSILICLSIIRGQPQISTPLVHIYLIPFHIGPGLPDATFARLQSALHHVSLSLSFGTFLFSVIPSATGLYCLYRGPSIFETY